MPGSTLLLLGSGPGVGLSIAKTFSVRGFTHIALVSRNAERLAKDQDEVLDAIQERGYSCQVRTYPCDLCDLSALDKVLKEVESFGSLECVVFNAARVDGKPPGEESVEAIEADFRLTNLSLYHVALWALPLLKTRTSSLPSLLVTNSLLYKEPYPPFMSLSLTKTAQRSLVQSLNATYGKEVHVGLITVGGQVSPEAKNLNPENIAEKTYEFYKQKRGQWGLEVEILE
nr:hypothetical protein B0A51_00011 [Rachicladosporium sp. CCFEE 5018]